ncbi:MAG: Fe-S-binding domain-containing protein, partial [Bdellovibrionales bacterium]|nr:Fe-S-binding domain-containing protein [Bdellovibrionales bacterium]
MVGLSQLAMSGSYLLSVLIFTPLVGALLLFFVRPESQTLARLVSLVFAGAAFVFSLIVLRDFEVGRQGMQLGEISQWIPSIGARYAVAVDGISIWLIVLTTLLTFLVVLASSSVSERVRAYLGCVLLLETGMLGAFLAIDGLTFYLFYELMLIPMYFLIGVWGGKRRIYAALKFFLYTALGSLLMLVSIVYLAWQHQAQFGEMSFFLGDWMALRFDFFEEVMLFAAFAFA